MYRIINIRDGAEIGVTDKLVYIKKGRYGSFAQTGPSGARGIAYKGVPYNLCCTDGVGAGETVSVTEYDGGDDTAEIRRSVAELEDAMCEQDSAVEERLAAIEDALCELDKS